MNLPANQIILSGLQPSGVIHLGNYLGAIKQWVALQADNTAYYCIVDQHAITVDYQPKELPEHILNTIATYLAAGLNPDHSTIFVQSHVPAHTELAWLLATQTPFGELSRMTQFKEKSSRQQAESLGLFAYPVLMSADILLYQTTTVPVGADQIQHIELTRDIARRFNNKFGRVFTIPKPFLNKDTARIMSLTIPTNKMSKSDEPNSFIAITDPPDVIRKKIMGAVTETEFDIRSNTSSISNLRNIYLAFSEEDPAAIDNRFSSGGYKEFKEELSELIIDRLAPLRQKYTEFRADESNLQDILTKGAKSATTTANQTLDQTKKAMGLTL